MDYNNDGQFNETTELVLNQSGVSSGSFATASVTPPASAVANIPLRMRVIGEFNGTAVTACYTPKYGQVEDYSVIIERQNLLSADNTAKKNNTEIIKDDQSVLIKSDLKISSLHIYDASGRLLINRTEIKSSEFRFPVNEKNTVLTVKAVLENGKIISKKLKF
nr:GEVED domain-containing protein [Chryseobacterium sp. W4I1]